MTVGELFHSLDRVAVIAAILRLHQLIEHARHIQTLFQSDHCSTLSPSSAKGSTEYRCSL